MLAVLFWLGLLGYAMLYSGIASWGTGAGPGILETLHPNFRGTLPAPGAATRGTSSTPPKTKAKTPGKTKVPSVGSTVPGSQSKQAKVQAFTRDVLARFPGSTSLGDFVCRRINHSTNPSDPWSEHAWWRAVDIGGPPEVLRRVAAYACKVKGKYGIVNVFYAGGGASCVNTGVPGHETHVHVGWGRPAGTPPCARGGGQQG